MKTTMAMAEQRDGTTAAGCTRVRVNGERYSLQAVVPPGEVEVIISRGYAFLPSPPEGTTASVYDSYTEVSKKPHKFDRHFKLPARLCVVRGGEWFDDAGQSRGIGPRPKARHTTYE